MPKTQWLFEKSFIITENPIFRTRSFTTSTFLKVGWTDPISLRPVYYLYSSGTLRSSRACWWASKMKSTTQLVCSVDSKARAWKNKKKKYNIFYIMFTQYCRENPSALSPSVDLTFFKKKISSLEHIFLVNVCIMVKCKIDFKTTTHIVKHYKDGKKFSYNL